MGNLLPIGLVTGIIAVVGIATGGWPGLWALVALLPGGILGATFAHMWRAKQGINDLRPGVIALGIGLGGMTTVAAVLIYGGASADPSVRLEAQVVVDMPPQLVWEKAADPLQRPTWSSLVRDVEPIGDLSAARPGKLYRALFVIQSKAVPVELEILEASAPEKLTWRVAFPAGTRMHELRDTVRLEAADGGTRVTHTLSYEVPEVMARVFDRLFIRGWLSDAVAGGVQALPGQLQR